MEKRNENRIFSRVRMYVCMNEYVGVSVMSQKVDPAIDFKTCLTGCL